MPTFARILVPTDFSELSVHAAEFAAKLAQPGETQIHVLHVVVPPAIATTVAISPGAGPLSTQPAIEALFENARTGVAEFARTHVMGIAAHAEVVVGAAYSEICRYARENSCDLIVIGSHARGMMHRLVFGSVSKAVLEHSPCPLLIVPLKAIETEV